MCLVQQPMVHAEVLRRTVLLVRCSCTVDVQVSVSHTAPKPCLLSYAVPSLCKRQQAKISQPCCLLHDWHSVLKHTLDSLCLRR